MGLKKPFLLITLLSFLLMVFIYLIAVDNAKNKLQLALSSQLLQVVNELEITLERHSYLPALLSSDPAIKAFLLTDENQKTDFLQKQLKMNLSLERTNNISESSVIYLMRPDGTTIASSNWESSHSFIGKNFSFRPYFQQAIHNVLGRYYAVGAISGERGYFFASSVIENEKVIGVIAVKVAVDDIEFTWGQGITDFLITDEYGVVFLASQKKWVSHSLQPLSPRQKKKLHETRRYAKKEILPLKDTKLDLNQYQSQKIRLLGKDYEMLSQKMQLANWDVRIIASYESENKQIIFTMFMSALILLLLISLAVLLWKAQQQRKQYQLQMTEKLEKKVAERTQALKQTQEELIQAAKMAALGQLSAGITHEINNPLTAIRAYADNAREFLQKNRQDMVESNLVEISNLTESMATITRQLKSFSRKSEGEITPVSLKQAINHALSIVHPKLISQSVNCHFNEIGNVSEESVGQKTNEPMVMADEVWLGQILVNLLSNAISATETRKERHIWITISQNDEHDDSATCSTINSQICIHVKDNGIGIDENTLPHIFEPFFTTKPSSKGLGLGLSISFNLAKEMNGSLRVKNLKTGGAEFILCLPEAGSP